MLNELGPNSNSKVGHNYTGCTCRTFLQYVFLNVSSKYLGQSMHNHIGCICLAFLLCVFSNESSNCLTKRIGSCIGCICWTLFTVHFQMCLQSTWIRACIVTLAACTQFIFQNNQSLKLQQNFCPFATSGSWVALFISKRAPKNTRFWCVVSFS